MNALKFLSNEQVEFICKVCNLSKDNLKNVSHELDDEITEKLLWIESDIIEKGDDDKDVRMAISIIDTWDKNRWKYGGGYDEKNLSQMKLGFYSDCYD